MTNEDFPSEHFIKFVSYCLTCIICPRFKLGSVFNIHLRCLLSQGKFIRIHFGPQGKIAGADIETCKWIQTISYKQAWYCDFTTVDTDKLLGVVKSQLILYFPNLFKIF